MYKERKRDFLNEKKSKFPNYLANQSHIIKIYVQGKKLKLETSFISENYT